KTLHDMFRTADSYIWRWGGVVRASPRSTEERPSEAGYRPSLRASEGAQAVRHLTEFRSLNKTELVIQLLKIAIGVGARRRRRGGGNWVIAADYLLIIAPR